jgi:hypothetical protein
MAAKISLRKVDQDILAFVHQRIINEQFLVLGKELKQWEALYERVKAAVDKPKRTPGEGISVARAIEVFRGALGRRLVVPAGQPGREWYIQLQRRISASGLTEALAKRAAEIAGAQWRGSIKAESIIRQADTLLSEGNLSVMGQAPDDAGDMSDL